MILVSVAVWSGVNAGALSQKHQVNFKQTLQSSN